MKNLFIFFILVLTNTFVFGQSTELLKAEGKIPREFITPSTVKYKKTLEQIKSKKKKGKKSSQRQKDKQQFILQSSFTVDDILQSGYVLFNDPATQYVNQVLEKLPVSDRKITKKKPRAYTLNSSAVNAFATDQGIIFVTLGLLANLENEAQLAFILAHELMHVKHQHATQTFIKTKEIERTNSSRNVDKVSIDRNFFEKNLYSRKLEEEADEEGLELFLKSKYDPSKILNVFHVLHYSYLPFEDEAFDYSFFEDENYQLPERLKVDEVNGISSMDESKEEEEKSTHPASAKRLKKIETVIEKLSSDGKETYLVSEDKFLEIRNKARYQIPFLELYDSNIPDAIYTSYLLLKENPDDVELKKVVGKALYMEAKYKNETSNYENRQDDLDDLLEDVEGSIHRIYHLLAKMTKEEIAVLATKYNWKIYQKNMTDEEMKSFMDDTFVQLAANFSDLDSFSEQAAPKIVATEEPEAKEDENLSKYEKIKRKKKKESTSKNYEHGFSKYAFVTELEKEAFKKAFKKGKKAYKDREKDQEYYESSEGQRSWNNYFKKTSKKGRQLGINKVVVVNPFYLSLDERKENSVQFIRSEEKQAFFRNSIKEIAKTKQVKATVLDVTDLSSSSVDKFNDLAEINQYFSQQMDLYDFSLTPGFNQNEINEIAKKYKTDYFLWTGVISLHQDKGAAWGSVILSLILPYYLPFTLANALTPDYDLLYYAILFDVKTGRRSVIKMDYFDKRDSKAILNAHIYDVFHQIKSKPKRRR